MMSERRALRLTNETCEQRELRRFKYEMIFLCILTVCCIILTAGGTYSWGKLTEEDGYKESTEAEKTAPETVLGAEESAPERTAAPETDAVISKVTVIDTSTFASAAVLSSAQIKSFASVPLDPELQGFVAEKCEEIGISPAIVFGMMYHESRYQSDAVGDEGYAVGIMQVRVDVHGERMAKLGCADMTDPYQCVTVALDYLAEQLDRYDGDIAKALTAYNRGSYDGTVSRYAELVIEQMGIIRGE